MSTSLPAVDRPIPTVAIVGTDAVLAAAPATPVQLAHACLRRGFTVAVPASWGDELIAAETLRRLATRQRGPAVMCVCPFVRARLLGHGADLAPFLVSLVPPPVAAARYVRSAYGEHGVHITYIGACPGADDPSIDARLTPDAFIADLADRGIALSEQPLVFDSIVPPDRRRWCSLPGGVPNADILSGETDGRTVVEIERDDVTTELAEHIIAREHLLLDLAPSLGCACSGAIGLVSADRARAAVAAAEPPRALSPVIDPGPVVSLDLPVTLPSERHVHELRSITPGATLGATLEHVLDEMLGVGATSDPKQQTDVNQTTGPSAVIVDLPQLPPVPFEPAVEVTTQPLLSDEAEASDAGRPAVRDDVGVAATGPVMGSEPVPVLHLLIESSADAEPASAIEASEPATVVEAQEVFVLGSSDTSREDSSQVVAPIAPDQSGPAVEEVIEPTGVEESQDQPDAPVRRRTPPAMLRYPGSSVPKATVANGRPLPRAYVAKRRTPPRGAVVISAVAPSATPAAPGSAEVAIESAPGAGTIANTPIPAVAPMAPVAASTADALGHAAPTSPPAPTPTTPVDSNAGGRAVARSTHPALVFLLVTALVALAVFVLLTLRR
jgi:hypothetical protein